MRFKGPSSSVSMSSVENKLTRSIKAHLVQGPRFQITSMLSISQTDRPHRCSSSWARSQCQPNAKQTRCFQSRVNSVNTQNASREAQIRARPKLYITNARIHYIIRLRLFSSRTSSCSSWTACSSSSDWTRMFSMPSLPSRKSPKYFNAWRISSYKIIC